MPRAAGSAKQKKSSGRKAASSVKKSVVREYEFDKDTPGTHRFQENGDKDDQLIPTIYFKKAQFDKLVGKSVKRVRVTIEAV